jgi:RNA polymerase sigma factor (sigma-70 family)
MKGRARRAVSVGVAKCGPPVNQPDRWFVIETRPEDMETLSVPQWQVHCEALYHEHAARLVRLGRLLLDDPAEAEEVAQDVFVKTIEAHRLGVVPIAWGPWLTRVMVNACRDRHRAGWWAWSRWRRSPFEGLELVDRRQGTPEQVAVGSEWRARIWDVFRVLPGRQREVFALRYIEGCSTAEVASMLKMSPGSVKRHLFRAVQRLRRALGGSR